jgi:hypothetical protein
MARKKPAPRPLEPVDYPDGVMVETGKEIYYIRGGKRFRLFSPRVFDSWGVKAIRSSDYALAKFPVARQPLGFRDGTLIHNMADGRLYLISSNQRRQIVNPDVFDRFGWERGDAILVSQQETDLHTEGEVIN